MNSVGVAGGTTSKKTIVCNMIIQQLHDRHVIIVHQVSLIFLSSF